MACISGPASTITLNPFAIEMKLLKWRKLWPWNYAGSVMRCGIINSLEELRGTKYEGGGSKYKGGSSNQSDIWADYKFLLLDKNT